jgi:PTS system mannose-specific IIC component
MYFLPIFLAVFVGTDLVQAIVNMVPEWLSTGLNVSTKIMTAYGLALLLTMMIKKGMTPFLFIGFLLAAYLNLSVIAVALIGVCLAVVFMGFKFNGSHAAAGVDSDYDPLEDDED